MKWCLDEVLWALNGLATQVPNAQVLSFLLLSLLHLINYRLKIVFSPRYMLLAPFLPWITKRVSLFLINLPHKTLCLCGRLSTCRIKYTSGLKARFTWHFCICGGKRQGKSGGVGSQERASLYMVEHRERHLYGGGQESGDSPRLQRRS